MLIEKISSPQRGSSLIEVLITFFIMTIGITSLMSFQFRLQLLDMDAYQRSQALILLNDMTNRIENNRNVAAEYTSATTYGVGMTCPSSTSSRKDTDLKEWCEGLQGAAELSGTSMVGSMIGGRGCVEELSSGQYMITVAWQGMTPLDAPPESVSCGLNTYNTAGSSCVGDLCRRTISTVVRVATL